MPKIEGFIYDGHFFDDNPQHRMFDTPPIKENHNKIKFLGNGQRTFYVKVKPEDIIKYVRK